MIQNNKPLLATGFSLVEMAIVLLVLGLLLGSVLGPLSSRIVNERIKSTNNTLVQIQDAIIGFAILNKRLPCPDTNGDGTEESNCNNTEGTIPWATIGVGRYDAWGRNFRFRIDNSFASTVADPPTTTSGMSVQDRSNPINILTITNPNAPIAIIFSCGSDGWPNGVNDANGVTNTTADCSNPGTPNTTYAQDAYVENQYDDILIWISKNTLINQLVAAGKWP